MSATHFGKFSTALLLLAGWVSLSGCRDSANAAKPAGATSGPLNVVCTIGMIADVVRIIGTDQVSVHGLMGEHVDPHLYKATPADHRLLSNADAIFYNGLHLEGRMADLFVQLARKKAVFAVTEKIDPSLLREPPEFAGQYDPHVWFDVTLWMSTAERIRDALTELRPAHKADFESRASRYLAQMTELHAYCKERIATIPRDRRVLVTAHDAFGYFGRAYGLEVLAIQGVSTESEAGLKKMNVLVDTLVQRRLPAVFVESSVNPRYIQALVEGCKARGHDVKIGGELFSDAMGADGTPEGTYLGMVRHNVDTIVKALTP